MLPSSNAMAIHSMCAGDEAEDDADWDAIDVQRYGPGVTATSGATAFFRSATWLERRYQLSGVLGECDFGVIFRCPHSEKGCIVEY